MDILTVDIETRPNKCWAWGIWQQNISPTMIIEPKRMICYAAKWLHKDKILFASEFHDGPDVMLSSLHDLLSRADGVVSYNGDRFDIKYINTEFFKHGLTPPAPYKSIDLYKVTKRRFAFGSNKLTAVTTEMSIGRKLEHEGWHLWDKCIAGDRSAWKRMRDYNKQDVRLTEQYYLKVLPWISGHPSHAAITGQRVCPNCGSERLQSRGTYLAATRRWLRFQCQACGKWSRDTQRFDATTITEAAL